VTLDVVMADDGIVFDGRTKDVAPLGGAETAFAELAEALAARGHRVRAYSRCAAPLSWAGVDWIPLERGVPDGADLYIANRSWRLILECRRAKRGIFWIHNPARYLLKWRYQWRLLKRRPPIVFSGANHRSTYPAWACGGARPIIPYGISAPFLGATERTEAPPPRAVFLSNPMRSLDWLLDLWAARIAPAVPGAELHIFGGASVYGGSAAAKSDRAAPIVARARSMEAQGVLVHGPVGKTQLAARLAEMRLFLYRGDIGETFCNAAAESQAMGVPGVVEDIACMAERVRDGTTGFVARDADGFAQAAIRLLSDPTLWLEQHRNCLKSQRSWRWAEAAAAFEAMGPAP